MRIKKTVFPVVAAWLLGAACFAFFLSTLDEPMPPRVVAIAGPAPPPPVASSALVEPPPPLIELDPIVIIGHVGRDGGKPAVTDDGWVCDAWRPLVQGDVAQRVKLCRTDGEEHAAE